MRQLIGRSNGTTLSLGNQRFSTYVRKSCWALTNVRPALGWSAMNDATRLIDDTILWLQEHYGDHPCWNEADVVSVIWDYARRLILARKLPLTIRNQHEIKTSLGKKKYDLAILDDRGLALVVVEVKYEPSPSRPDVPRVLKHFKWEHLVPGYHGKDIAFTDIEKVRRCVEEGKADIGYAIFIDEGSHHYQRMPANVLPDGVVWRRWGPGTTEAIEVSVMVARFPNEDRITQPRADVL